jgi:hypothetical protein
MEKVKVYNLNITVYEDDYYDRLSFKQPESSSTDYKYIFNKLTNFILDYIYKHKIYDIKLLKSKDEYVNYIYDKYKLQDISDLNELREDYLKGVYIPFLIRYDITTEELVNHQTLSSLANEFIKVNH